MRTRLQDRLDQLREQEASAWAVARDKAEAVDEKFRQLEIDLERKVREAVARYH